MRGLILKTYVENNGITNVLGILKPLAYLIIYIVIFLTIAIVFVYYSPLIYPFQVIETRIVHSISTAMGIDARIVDDGLTIEYPPPLYGVRTGPDCTGVIEMFLMAGLVFGFIGKNLRKHMGYAIKSVILLDIIIFIENIIRQAVNYPVASTYGYRFWREFHYFWWQRGQFIFIMVIFVIWYAFSYRKRMMSDTENKCSHENSSPEQRFKD